MPGFGWVSVCMRKLQWPLFLLHFANGFVGRLDVRLASLHTLKEGMPGALR